MWPLVVALLFPLFHAIHISSTTTQSLQAEFVDRWMSLLPSDISISDVNIPGTHDSFTNKLRDPNYSKTQDRSPIEQLDLGIRFLDFRCRNYKRTCAFHHSDSFTGYYWDKTGIDDGDSTSESIGDDIYRWLHDHDSEFILVRLSNETGQYMNPDSDISFQEMVSLMVNTPIEGIGGPSYWYTGSDIPKVHDVRRKLVLLREYSPEIDHFGIDYHAVFDIQDEYLSLKETKWNQIVDHFYKGFNDRVNCGKKWFMNYCSAAPGVNPSYISNYINPRLVEWLGRHEWHQYLGVVPMDYFEPSAAKTIAFSNLHARPQYFSIARRDDPRKGLEVNEGDDDSGARVQLWTLGPYVWQHWFAAGGRGYRNRATGMYLSVQDRSDGAGVYDQSVPDASLSQRTWTFNAYTNRLCIRGRLPDRTVYCLETNNGASHDGAKAQIWTENDNAYARWTLINHEC